MQIFIRQKLQENTRSLSAICVLCMQVLIKDDASNTIFGWLNTGTTIHSFTDISGLSLGSYRTYNISVSAVNKAGLRSAPISRLFYVETTPPTVTSMWFILQKVLSAN